GDTYTAVGNQNRAIEVDLTLKLQSMFLSCCSLRAYDLFICKALHTIILVDHTLTIKTSFFYNFLDLICFYTPNLYISHYLLHHTPVRLTRSCLARL
ncbi:unnamed protein product, partial [Brassica oleracea]